jgi:hypothetical protein
MAAGSFLQGSGLSGADGVSAASFTCTEEGDPDDPSIYYKNCNGMRLKGQCDKGQTWNAGVGCVDTLGSTAGNDYAGYKRGYMLYVEHVCQYLIKLCSHGVQM